MQMRSLLVPRFPLGELGQGWQWKRTIKNCTNMKLHDYNIKVIMYIMPTHDTSTRDSVRGDYKIMTIQYFSTCCASA